MRDLGLLDVKSAGQHFLVDYPLTLFLEIDILLKNLRRRLGYL